MTDLLPRLLEAGQSGLVVGFVVFLRIGAMLALVPAFSERMVPERVRLALALAFTAVVAPAVAPEVQAALKDGRGLLLAALAEIAVGLLFGILFRLFVIALQVTGSIAAQSTSLAQVLGNAAAEPVPAMGQIMVVSALALAVMAGLHVHLSAAMIGSYIAFPPGVFPTPALVADWGTTRIAAAFALAFSLAAPFVIASFIYNVALGVINKAMPQLMVAFVGAPAITAGGLILLALTLPIALSVWHRAFSAFLAAPLGGAP